MTDLLAADARALLAAEEFDIYYSVDDVEPDEPVLPDGDDWLLAESGGIGVDVDPVAPAALLGTISAAPKRRVVPFVRDLKRGMSGADVEAVKRSLNVAAGKKPGTPTRLYGDAAVKAVRAFQQDRNLKVDGVYGEATHKKLAPFFGPYALKLMIAMKDGMDQRNPISLFEGLAVFLYNNRSLVHYTQSASRMYGIRNNLEPPKVTPYEDCSSGYSYLCFYAGMPDPNGGTAYTGQGKTKRPRSSPQGYTGTLIVHGQRITSPKRGCAIFYGSPISHIAAKVGTKGMCWSHGSEIGPLLIDYRYRTPTAYRLHKGLG